MGFLVIAHIPTEQLIGECSCRVALSWEMLHQAQNRDG